MYIAGGLGLFSGRGWRAVGRTTVAAIGGAGPLGHLGGLELWIHVIYHVTKGMTRSQLTLE